MCPENKNQMWYREGIDTFFSSLYSGISTLDDRVLILFELCREPSYGNFSTPARLAGLRSKNTLLMLEGRKAALLEAVVAEHIRTAEPVGSKLLAGKYGLSVSSATVRNDLSSLEEEGYLTHPHTSAGRVPTVKGYRYYVQHCIAEKSLKKKEQALFEERCDGVQEARRRTKALAKAVADCAQEAIFVGFSRDDVYYTGISYLFAQPEFAQQDIALHLSQVLDHLDESMDHLMGIVVEDYIVAIGDESPFGVDTTVIVVRYGEASDQIFGILGPTRMEYAENIARVRAARALMQEYIHG